MPRAHRLLREACDDVDGDFDSSNGICKVEGGEISTFGPTQRHPDRPEGVQIDFEDGGDVAIANPDRISGYARNPEDEEQDLVIEVSKGESSYMKKHNRARVNAGQQHVDLPDEFKD